MESPLGIGRKRDRNSLEADDDIAEKSNQNEQGLLYGLSDLTIEELNTAQMIAKSAIQNACFLSIDIEADHNKMNPFVLKSKSRNRAESNPFLDTDPFDCTLSNPSTPKSHCLKLSDEVDYSSFAPLLHSVVPLFLQQLNINPTMISLESEMTLRSNQIKDWIIRNNTELILVESDAMEIGRVISHVLQHCKTLIPAILKPACQSVLAVNQSADSSRKIKGTSLIIPTPNVKTMIRFVASK